LQDPLRQQIGLYENHIQSSKKLLKELDIYLKEI
jgi:hypothetical protein